MESLLYISRSNLPGEQGAAEVDRIVQLAQARNRELEITGALLFSGAHFAQIIEGPATALNGLMNKIAADVRHKDLVMLQRSQITERTFARWNMAYSGQSSYVDRHIRMLYHNVPATLKAEAVRNLLRLIHAMSEAESGASGGG